MSGRHTPAMAAGAFLVVVLGAWLLSRSAEAPPSPNTLGDADVEDGGGDAFAALALEPCEKLVARIKGQLGTPDDALSNDARDELFFDARRVGRREPADAGAAEPGADTCRSELFSALASRTTCGRAEAALAGGLFAASGVDPEDVHDAVEHASPQCTQMVVEAAGFSAAVDRPLLDAVERRMLTGSPRVRESAWLAFGSLGEVARSTGNDVIAERVDTVLVRATKRMPLPTDVRTLLGAVGNAGCEKCGAFIRRYEKANTPEVRRVAATAWRFVPGRDAARSMCAHLETDDDGNVRDSAAWALGFRSAEDAVRVPCLLRAARSDKSPRVRSSSALSLSHLAPALPPARAALVQVTGEETPEDTRAFAKRLLATESPETLGGDERTLEAFFRRAEQEQRDAGDSP